jgi:riboflavin kinase
MAESVPATSVNHDELAALKQLGLDGGLSGRTKISCAGLAARLGTSTQTASRRLQQLDDADLLEREVVADGQFVAVTDEGVATLRREYADYRRLFEDDTSISLEGTVTSGMGEGRHYISLSGYKAQFRDRLGYEPFAGTLNLELTEESTRVRGELGALEEGVTRIDGWEDDERTFGPATCYAVRLEAAEDSYDGAHVIVPDRTHHDPSQLELIAPVKLREELDISDGDSLTVHLGEA